MGLHGRRLISVTRTDLIGGFAGVAASAGVTGQITNADTVFELNGLNLTAGGSLGVHAVERALEASQL